MVLVGVLWAAIEWTPIGQPTTTRGRVVAVGYGGSKNYRGWARVSLSGREVTIDYFFLTCAVGDVLTVQRQRHIWGYRYSTGEPHCEKPPLGRSAMVSSRDPVGLRGR
jgi:hypothetical protein